MTPHEILLVIYGSPERVERWLQVRQLRRGDLAGETKALLEWFERQLPSGQPTAVAFMPSELPW